MATFEKRVGKTGKTTWRVRVRRQSGPWLTKSFARKIEAEAWARSIEHKLDTGESVPSSEARKRTLGDAIDRYLQVTLPQSKFQKNTREQTRMLTWWKEELGSRPLVTVTASTIAEVRDRIALEKTRTGKVRSGATVNRRIAALSAVLTVAVKEYGWIPKNPVPNVTRMPDSKARERFLSETERRDLLACCDVSDLKLLGPLVRLALATGARKGELLGLQWQHVDLDRRTVRFLDTKNGESRTVPLAPAAVEVLRQWKAGRLPVGAVFPETVDVVDKYWREARGDAGLTDFRFHDLRHSAASYLAMSGASLMDIAAILGHKTLAMVKRYSHLSEQHTTAAVDRMAERFLG
ncbi:integrase [Lysobacter xinjiangensis]|uniref:Integrase n=1 Tax=Cognatilysobacter xinjiangensis TaxID=546892 RepID=A0ABQ3BSA8_9GAMM|nr:site-specific integrase [Lysobacter xinjiangensis]GGZ55996.1 integrase [Lysobacter xinjiangensis]